MRLAGLLRTALTKAKKGGRDDRGRSQIFLGRSAAGSRVELEDAEQKIAEPCKLHRAP